mmetsp:Transcript_10915/g.17884  ORF Transcript_10915/g.17884 Transcript_10915/m.17884 type:complete len:105 (+) Transcript_10915:440-754(+)
MGWPMCLQSKILARMKNRSISGYMNQMMPQLRGSGSTCLILQLKTVSLYQQCIINESRAALLRATRFDPSKIQLWFDLSILLLQQAIASGDDDEEEDMLELIKD